MGERDTETDLRTSVPDVAPPPLHLLGLVVLVDGNPAVARSVAIGLAGANSPPQATEVWTAAETTTQSLAEQQRVLDVCHTLAGYLNSGGNVVLLQQICETAQDYVGDTLQDLATLQHYDLLAPREYALADGDRWLWVIPGVSTLQTTMAAVPGTAS